LVPVSDVAAAGPPPAQDTKAFCVNLQPNNPFTGVGPGVHHDNIVCLTHAGLTTSRIIAVDGHFQDQAGNPLDANNSDRLTEKQ
jgi:hypothetical protein